jgi:hypothetical protein
MYYTIEIPLEFYYDKEDIIINYSFNVTENLQDIIEFLFEEEYGMPYFHSSWFLEEGAREFINNLQTLWNTNSIDTFSLYSNDTKFRQWLVNKYYNDAKEQYVNENTIDNTEEKLDESIEELYD